MNTPREQEPKVTVNMLVEGTVPSEWFLAMKNERDSLRGTGGGCPADSAPTTFAASSSEPRVGHAAAALGRSGDTERGSDSPAAITREEALADALHYKSLYLQAADERDRYREALERVYQTGEGVHVEIAREALNRG